MPEESTTPDLVELTRVSFQAATSRDFDVMLSFYGPDPVWDVSTVLLQTGRPVGRPGHVQLRSASVSTWVGGLLARTTNYSDLDEARAAAERLAEERR